MKRFWTVAAVLLLIGFTLAFAAEKPQVAAPLPPRTPEMSTAGKVLAVSDVSLKIERTLKGEAEIMEFVLEQPFANIAVGDQVKVSYRQKEGRNILLRVAPAKMTAVQKPKKEPSKEKPAGDKAGSPAKK